MKNKWFILSLIPALALMMILVWNNIIILRIINIYYIVVGLIGWYIVLEMSGEKQK